MATATRPRNCRTLVRPDVSRELIDITKHGPEVLHAMLDAWTLPMSTHPDSIRQYLAVADQWSIYVQIIRQMNLLTVNLYVASDGATLMMQT